MQNESFFFNSQILQELLCAAYEHTPNLFFLFLEMTTNIDAKCHSGSVKSQGSLPSMTQLKNWHLSQRQEVLGNDGKEKPRLILRVYAAPSRDLCKD